MATIYRALVTSVLLLVAYTVMTGFSAAGGEEALRWHLRVGLVASILGVAVHSVPFAYFLGTGFWVKAFVRASRAGPEWEAGHAQWMKVGGYKIMYAAAALPAGAAITGALVETGRIGGTWHPLFVFASLDCHVAALVTIPPMNEPSAKSRRYRNADEVFGSSIWVVLEDSKPLIRKLVTRSRAVSNPYTFCPTFPDNFAPNLGSAMFRVLTKRKSD